MSFINTLASLASCDKLLWQETGFRFDKVVVAGQDLDQRCKLNWTSATMGGETVFGLKYVGFRKTSITEKFLLTTGGQHRFCKIRARHCNNEHRFANYHLLGVTSFFCWLSFQLLIFVLTIIFTGQDQHQISVLRKRFFVACKFGDRPHMTNDWKKI